MSGLFTARHRFPGPRRRVPGRSLTAGDTGSDQAAKRQFRSPHGDDGPSLAARTQGKAQGYMATRNPVPERQIAIALSHPFGALQMTENQA